VIPVKILWDGINSAGFEDGVMLVFRGYIDESGNDRGMFTLACLVGHGPSWFYIENKWQEVLDQTNASLVLQGRKPLERYHASDCSNLLGDFEGWSIDEQVDFVKRLLSAFVNNALHGYGYTINLAEMAREIPETAPNPEGFARVILLQMLMHKICEATLTLYTDSILSLVHDHCDYDAAMLEAFNQILDDSNFRCRHRFTTLTPMRWQDCLTLQPADLFAYETFKDAERQSSSRKRRKSLDVILSEASLFSGSGASFNKPAFEAIKRNIDSLDTKTREILLATARVIKTENKKKVKRGK